MAARISAVEQRRQLRPDTFSAHHMEWRWATPLSGCSGSTAQELVVPTVAITKLGIRPACNT
jgi:hypothetical protein